MFPTLLSCGGSVLDRPAAETPVRPVPVVTGAVSLSEVPASFDLPRTVRPEGAPAPEAFALLGPFVFDDDRKKADVYKVPLPVAADLLPTPTRGTHTFGSAPPPGLHVTGPGGELPFEQLGRKPGTYGFDREWLYVGVAPGAPAPVAADHQVTFAKATAAESAMNLDSSGMPFDAFVHRTFTVGGTSHAGWFLPAPATAAVHLTVPERGVLAFGAGLLPPAITSATASDGATVIVTVAAGGETTEVSRTVVEGTAFRPVRVDLGRWAGQEIDLRVWTDPGPTSTFDYVLLEDPVVYPAKEHPRKFVVLFVDTLRPDHLGFMGYPRATSPHLDRWAASAAVFTQARTVAPWTLPSARSVLTGAEPEDWFQRQTLAGRLATAGFRTDAIVSNAFLSQPFGLERGWARFRYSHLLPPDALVDDALERLAEWPDRDQLVLVHFMGPHLPYDEPWTYARWWAGAKPEALKSATRGQIGAIHQRSPDFDAVRDWVVARYDQNVRWVDDEVAALVEAAGPDATVVLFSDHGEELWDHDGFEHGHAFGDELLRVPLVVKGPGMSPGRFPSPVSLLDVTPTLLELAGLPPDPDAAGRSLVGYTFGDPGAAEFLEARPLGFGRPLYGDDGWGVVTQGHKWTARGGGQTLFDLAKDPGEQSDLAAEASDLARYPDALSAALGRPVRVVWRLTLDGDPWPYGLTLTASHPSGLARVWSGYDPRGRAAGTVPEVVEGRVSMPVAAEAELPSVLYLLPNGDPLDPSGLALTLVGRQVRVAGAVANDTHLTPSTVGGRPFLAARDARYALRVDLAVVPEPSGTEVSGFHPDLEAQLRELGYLGDGE